MPHIDRLKAFLALLNIKFQDSVTIGEFICTDLGVCKLAQVHECRLEWGLIAACVSDPEVRGDVLHEAHEPKALFPVEFVAHTSDAVPEPSPAIIRLVLKGQKGWDQVS